MVDYPDSSAYDSNLDPDVNPALSQSTAYATTSDGVGYTTVGQPDNDLYDPDLWLNNAGIRNPRLQQEPTTQERPEAVLSAEEELAAYERHFEKMQQQGVANLDAQIISTNLSHMNSLFSAPQFQEYLDSDDDSYQQVELNPQLLAAIERTWGIDDATAKSFAKFYNLSAQQMQVLASTLDVDLSSEPLMSYSTQPTQSSSTWDDQDSEDSEDEYQAPAHTPEQLMASLRMQHFPAITNAEWQQVQNQVVDAFQMLSPKEQEQFDSADGFVRLYNLTKGIKKGAAKHQQQKQQQQQVKQRIEQHTGGRVPANALTPEGKLKKSYIDKLSQKQYEAYGQYITNWMNKGLVDWRA